MPDLAYETYTLPNGLRVILHEDHALPVVAVNVWFMRGVDEVEVMDNLWAGFAGLNAHIVIGAGWIAAASRGFAPAPNVPGVMAATVVVTLLAYGALKLRRRLG